MCFLGYHGEAMDQSRKPRIADGQEAVFRYGEQQSGGKSSFGNPRLLCILVCPVILIIVLLAISINSIWVNSLDRGLHKAEVADASLLEAFNESSTAARMRHEVVHVCAFYVSFAVLFGSSCPS